MRQKDSSNKQVSFLCYLYTSIIYMHSLLSLYTQFIHIIYIHYLSFGDNGGYRLHETTGYILEIPDVIRCFFSVDTFKFGTINVNYYDVRKFLKYNYCRVADNSPYIAIAYIFFYLFFDGFDCVYTTHSIYFLSPAIT